ncbi:porin family protein [Chitinophaga sp. XS-30]|uniref:porin family protein n=1 Tax=Chitinophaga sp. XS-30 TaxID=2604421 RepID=UPI0011DCFEE9|nr:porin family protein [Chitinophaga sp. XS-30]QEH39529.1 PorT family protein [Chitinophaga sp. XS-30]
MKKVMILMALVTQASIVNAQTKISFGPKAGVNFSVWTGEGSQGAAFRTGYYAGGFVSVPVSKSFSLQPELMYSLEGTDHNVTKYTDKYLRLPFLFQYRHSSGFHAEAGPQIGWLISTWAKMKNGDPDVDAKEMRAPLETSLGFGFGWQLKAGIGFNFRYNAGISGLGDNSKLKAANIGIGAYYAFR